MEQINRDNTINHLAGIVPIAGQALDFNMPWMDCLTPIAQNYLAVERAVFQCVLAGCETIWIVGHLGTQPLVRKRVGDVVIDPVPFEQDGFLTNKEVSIYYVPIHPRDRMKRDCLGWSTLYGADIAFRISKFISKWIAPERFFCSFPYGIVPDENLRESRRMISSSKKTIFSFDNKTVKHNLHLPFTFEADDFFRCRDIVKHKQAEEWGQTSARYYDLATVFKGLDEHDSNVVNLPWFHDISSWEKYKNYLASPESNLYKKPISLFRGYKRKVYKNEQVSRENLQSNEQTVQK